MGGAHHGRAATAYATAQLGRSQKLLSRRFLIIEHRELQGPKREHTATECHEGGWMLALPNGKPIDPRRDQYEWKALLQEAGVREPRLHDARHTAATILLLLSIPERAVMDVMGWSNSAMVKRYAHVTARLRRDIADRLDSYF
jgi:integrase